MHPGQPRFNRKLLKNKIEIVFKWDSFTLVTASRVEPATHGT